MLLQCAANVVDSIARTPRVDHFKYHIVAYLQLADHGIVLCLCRRRLFVDPDDHKARLKTLQIRKRPSPDRLNDHTLGVEPAADCRGCFADYDSELGFSRVAFLIGGCVGLWIIQLREDLIAITHCDRGIGRFAIANKSEPNAGTWFAAGNLIDQIVAVLDWSAIHLGDDVTRLEPSLIGGAARLNLLHQYASFESIDAIN